MKRNDSGIKIEINSKVTFFGCPEEASPQAIFGEINILHSTLKKLKLDRRKVSVRAVGQAKVFWEEDCSYFAVMASRKKLLFDDQQLDLYPDTSTCPSYQATTTIGSRNNLSRRRGSIINLEVDYSHKFQFHFKLDGNLPSSFEDNGDGIFYGIEVVATTDETGCELVDEVILANAPFTVNRCELPLLPPSLEHLPELVDSGRSTPTSTASTSPSASPRFELSNMPLTPLTPTQNVSYCSELISSPSLFHNLSEVKYLGKFDDLKFCIVTSNFIVLNQPCFKLQVLFTNPAKNGVNQAYITASLKQVVESQVDQDPTLQVSGNWNGGFNKSNQSTISKTQLNQKINLNNDPNRSNGTVNDCGLNTTVLINLPLSNKLVEDLDCDLIRVYHNVKFQLKLNRFTTKKLVLNFPILVTSTIDIPPPYSN